MDDLDDQLHDQEEMNDMFSRPIGQDTYMTDADLESGRQTKIRVRLSIPNALFRIELAGLAEEEFGMESNAMFNDLHAPSVPVHPLDGGQAGSTTKVCSDIH